MPLSQSAAKAHIDRSKYGQIAVASNFTTNTTSLTITIPSAGPDMIVSPIKIYAHAKLVGQFGVLSTIINPLLNLLDTRQINIARFRGTDQITNTPAALVAVSTNDRIYDVDLEVSAINSVTSIADTDLRVTFNAKLAQEAQYLLVVYKTIQVEVI